MTLLLGQTVRGEDAVTAGNLNPLTEVAPYYGNGRWANRAAVIERTPHAHHFGIATALRVPGCRCFDIEEFDGTPAQAPEWYHNDASHTDGLPILYADLSNMPAVRDAMDNAHIVRSGYYLWLALYDNIAGIPLGYDGKQYATNGVDLDIWEDYVFVPAKPKPKQPSGIARATVSFNLTTGEMELHHLPGSKVEWGELERFASQEIQIGTGGKVAGQWRRHPMPFNAKPLGG